MVHAARENRENTVTEDDLSRVSVQFELSAGRFEESDSIKRQREEQSRSRVPGPGRSSDFVTTVARTNGWVPRIPRHEESRGF